MSQETHSDKLSPWRRKMHEVIFEADTRTGKLFDVILLILILASMAVVMLESVVSINQKYSATLWLSEWIITGLFTIEYFARIISVERPLKYIFSFYGIVDLVSILPTFIGLFISGAASLATIRSIRLVRVFRILKLGTFVKEVDTLRSALIASRPKIIVFIVGVFSIVTIMGTIMYVIEDPKDGFTSIPRCIYWAIVTLTTVGYGDISPHTVLGQFFASLIMIMGYAIITIPALIVYTENTRIEKRYHSNTQACGSCSKDGHDDDAEHCKYCGAKLYE